MNPQIIWQILSLGQQLQNYRQRWTAWRCGDMLCSVRRQMKPNRKLMYKFTFTA